MIIFRTVRIIIHKRNQRLKFIYYKMSVECASNKREIINMATFFSVKGLISIELRDFDYLQATKVITWKILFFFAFNDHPYRYMYHIYHPCTDHITKRTNFKHITIRGVLSTQYTHYC